MFDIFVKRSVVNVDCFTNNVTAYNNFRIDTASKFYPEEFKKFPNIIPTKANFDPESRLEKPVMTIRKCNGVTDLFSSGMVLPSWYKFTIEITETGKVMSDSQTADAIRMDVYRHHDRIQYGWEIYKGWTHAKLLSPWLLEEKTGVKFTWNMCDWHRTDLADKVRILSAVIDFKYQIHTHTNCFIKNGSIISYEAGDPLVHIIPLTEKKLKLHHHLLDNEEYSTKLSTVLIQTTYSNHRKLNLPEQVKGKCPFGFKK